MYTSRSCPSDLLFPPPPSVQLELFETHVYQDLPDLLARDARALGLEVVEKAAVVNELIAKTGEEGPQANLAYHQVHSCQRSDGP
jgi:hypothetical protein